MKSASLLVAAAVVGLCSGAAVPPPADDPSGEAPAETAAVADPAVEQREYLRTPNGLLIRLAVIDDNAYNNTKFSAVPEIKYITIHNTAEPYYAMQERTRVNTRTSSVTSFQFAVDEKEAVQILPDGTHGWHAGDKNGDGNMKSIGIEICRSMCIGADGHLYEGAEANAVKLCAYLLRKYHLTTADMRMHNDWTGKHCPHRILDAGSWDDFKKRVDLALKSETSDPVKFSCVVPDTAKRDMGGVNISTRDGKVVYNTMYSRDFTDIPALVADLKANGITAVDISSWIMDYDMAPLMTALSDAGIAVESCYVPVPSVPDWVRRNLSTTITPTESE
ncbi:MAG: N-acetylmuramoyl-L-alanine amidase [Victivallaceae bacterium]|nr:N-acetylmuramoyl-L-alanine amidase [Victivallaceae bacterium]